MTKIETLKASRRLRAKAGFTLMEVLIVLAIIALIVGVVGVGVQQVLENSKADTARTELKGLSTALDTMQLDIGRYPEPDSEGLGLLVNDTGVPGWRGSYLKKGADVPKDPWGRDYIYSLVDGEPEIKSLGKDGQPGGEKNNEDIVE